MSQVSPTNENFGYLAPQVEEVSSAQIIKIKMIELGLTLTDLAREFGCRPVELTMCINQHRYRTYPELRRQIAMKIGMSYKALWGNPSSRQRSNASINRMERKAA